MSATSFVLVDIEADAAFCIAAPELAGQVDRPVATHPITRHALVPASSLIGGLRAHAVDTAPGRVDELFGTIGGPDDDGRRGGHRTLVRALGASVATKGSPVKVDDLEIRRQTAIDRQRGAAATTMLRTSQTVAAGATIRLYLEVLDSSAVEQVAELASTWRPTVGGGRSVGLGAASVTAVRWGSVDFATPEGVRLLMQESGPSLVEAVATNAREVSAPAGEPLRAYRFSLASPVLVRGEIETPQGGKSLRRALQRGGTAHIDGSSWKGLFRSGCQFVVDSIAAASGRPTSTAAVDLLFGTTTRRGLLRFSETPIAEATEATRTHVAIDRITGGASDRRLFTDRPVERGRVSLSIHSDGDLPSWAGQLLDAVALDLHDGLLGVGGATSRGYGSVRLDAPPAPTNLSMWVDALLLEGTE